ncbi:MAG: GerMN domain-containing protein [Acidobacteria bacterium]|nr:GerMN domain-containing protein [Acidobacteriota bacterium]MCZ6726711.1 GerMN domain-containing protein [Acidobacteriota bacterium]
MNRQQALILVSASVLVGLIFGALWIRRGTTVEESAAEPNAASEMSAAVTGSVTLYFPGADGRLHPEVRGLDTSAEGAELVRRIVAGILSGPDTEGLFAPLPQSTKIGSALLGTDGTLYLDLSSSEYKVPPVAGSQRELLAAYSLVNSICGNVPRVSGVVLLWNSEQRTTFAGNLDTTRPLVPNRRFVSSSS